MPKAKHYLDVENKEQLRQYGENGERIQLTTLHFDVIRYISSGYLLSSFFLAFFMSMAYLESGDQTRNCQMPIYFWYKLTLGFYLSTFFLCLVIVTKMKNDGLQRERVNLGWLEFVMFVYSKS